MLVCAVPVAAGLYPRNSKGTQEALSNSLRLMFRDRASLRAGIWVRGRTVVSPWTGSLRPWRVRTTGGGPPPNPPLPPAPPRPAAAAGPAAAPGAAGAPGPATGPAARGAPGPPG